MGERLRPVVAMLGLVVTLAGCAPAAHGAPLASSADPSQQTRSPGASAPSRQPAAARPGPGRVQVLALSAPDAPGGLRRTWVYRPGVPESSDLPVVYFLHGLPGSYGDLAGLGVRDVLDAAFTRGRLRPFVLVAPDGTSTGAEDPEWADSRSHGVSLESFVTGPLVDAVEGSTRRSRSRRAITGFSMGGYGAMNLALRHSDLYGQVASVAGYFDTDDASGVFDDDPALLAANSPDRNLSAADRLEILLADGSEDTLDVTRGETRRFATLLHARRLAPVVDIRPGGHDGAYLRGELPRVFDFLDARWPAPDSTAYRGTPPAG